MNRGRNIILGLCTVVIWAGQAVAGTAELTFSTPTNIIPMPIIVTFVLPGGGQSGVPVTIPPGTPVNVKRDMVVAALVAAGYQASAQPNLTKCTIQNLAVGTTVGLLDGGTGEVQDSASTPGATSGGIAFPGHFDPMTYQNQPAVFRAGIVTDVGVLTAEVSASELNFQTDGPIICQALFQRLVPRAPQYGAQINYAGDRLEVYFDPAYTATTGGTIGGTTSRGQGNQTNITIPQPVQPPVHPGDMNCDGVVNALDIDGMVRAILDPAAWQAQHPGCNILNGDFDGDGLVTPADIAPFIQRVMQ